MTNIQEVACYWTADLCIMKTRKLNLVVHVMKNRWLFEQKGVKSIIRITQNAQHVCTLSEKYYRFLAVKSYNFTQ